MIIVYSTDYCPYCTKATTLLDIAGLEYEEIDITNDPKLREEVMTMAGGRKTVPQIFFKKDLNTNANIVHIGGFDDLSKAFQSGYLAKLVKTI